VNPLPAAADPAAAAAATVDTPAVGADAAPAAEPVSVPVIADDAIAGFFQMITNFTRTVSESFEIGGNGSSYRYQYAESFKLELLKAVFTTAAPADSEPVAAKAAQLIDVLNGSTNSGNPQQV
jgi:hypothetical protein